MPSALRPYFKKRDFAITSEPQGGSRSKAGRLAFVVQKHAASHLHYDFRLELDGTLKSWAVPKGPSLDPADKRMAVHVEDHPLDYGRFEGEIPAGQYGAGSVIVWDNGTWEPIGDARAGYRAGKLKFRLHGKKLTGGWTLVRMHGRATERQDPWLLIKERDEAARPAAQYSVVEAEPGSVLSNRTIANPPPRATKKGAGSASRTKAAAAGDPAGKKAAARTRAASANASAQAAPAPLALPAGAKPAALPATLSPQLATLVADVPADDGWIYEIKFDGYRLLARIDGDDVRLYTRNGNDWSSRLKSLVDAVRALRVGSAWLDGEIVVAGGNGAPDFNLLQNAFDSARTDSIQYFLFDIPYYAGHDLRAVPLGERRALLRALLDAAPGEGDGGRIRFSEDFRTRAEELLHNACRMKLEGVIGKRADSPYVSRRSPAWIKLKCTQRQEFVIGGYTDPKGSRTGIGSLLLGIHDEAGALHFAGGVGSGFDRASLAALKKTLSAIDSDTCPFVAKPPGKAHWVEPKRVAEVSFGEWTPDGHIRHAVFHGLRSDKPAESIIREQPAPAAAVATAARAEAAPVAKTSSKPQAMTQAKANTHAAAARAASPAQRATAAAPARRAKAAAEATVEGVRISHPDRVIDVSTGITKLDVVNYYLEAARLILPHLAGRPVSLVRAPAGLGGQIVFQRHAGTLRIAGLKELPRSIAPDLPPMIEIDSFAALIGAAQANVIEFHTWNTSKKNPTRPDRMIFDLDPGEGVAWKQMQEGAELTHAFLAEIGLASFLKTSGGKGLHVVVPIAPKDGWDTVKALARRIVEHLAQVLPERIVAKSGPKNRVGRIFIDYLRNGFGATTASAWSARARPGLGVSVPCEWSELGSLSGGAHWTIVDVHERIEARGDAWRDYAKTRQTTARAMKALGVEPGDG